MRIEGGEGSDSFGNYFVGVEDASDLDDLVVPRKDSNEAPSTFRFIYQFPAPSIDPDRKRLVVISIPEDAHILSPLVGEASYIKCLVTEEDQVKIDVVEMPCLFNEA